MRTTAWGAARMVAGAAILAVIVWRLGSGPFREGFSSIGGWSLAAAAALTGATTVCSAWRWRLVARGLGIDVTLPAAIAAYYRSQFLNSALPGGVVGDLHRAVRHGREVRDVSRALRAVAWERVAGQAVQVALALLVLLALPSPVRSAMPLVVASALIIGLGAAAVLRCVPSRGSTRWGRMVRTARDDLRAGVVAPTAAPGILVASCGVVAGHTAVFVLAARTVGSNEPLGRLLPLAMLVLLATSVPTNIGGWGPREGAAAWVFGAAGFGAQQGVAVATAYGVLAFVATLPGAVVLVVAWRRRGRRPTANSTGELETTAAQLDGAVYG
ncbi:MAG: hypothetical protein QOC66_4134 [Pseudonocardiales bacterium]|nr:hypothetical protein [Pseudonocardiales bacterium]